ncbi:MAG: hypothetical protein ABSF85_17510 [Terriglobales bacterium]|jgi:hypothetical protein
MRRLLLMTAALVTFAAFAHAADLPSPPTAPRAAVVPLAVALLMSELGQYATFRILQHPTSALRTALF